MSGHSGSARPPIRLGVLGLGHVGSAVVRAAHSARPMLDARGLRLQFAGALVRDRTRDRPEARHVAHVTGDAEAFLSRPYDVVIEAMGGVDPARSLVTRVLSEGTPVVTANKSLMAACGRELAAVAARHATGLRYEASVLAGVPFLGMLERRPLAAGIDHVAGIVNGTTNFILTRMAERGTSYAVALAEAQALGFAEPDPSFDVDGVDAVEKLTVLLEQLTLGRIDRCAIETTGIGRLTHHDLEFARSLSGAIKPIVYADWSDGRVDAFVGPALVPRTHVLARVSGVANAIRLRSRSIGELTFEGPGAGPDVTAATILDDVVEIVEEGFRGGCERAPAAPLEVRAPETGWLVRLSGNDLAGECVEVAAFLAAHGVFPRHTSPLLKIDARGVLYMVTHACSRERLACALRAVEQATGAEAFAIRSLDD